MHYGLDGYEGHIRCPHCGDTDCAGINAGELVCAKTKRPVTDEQLRQQAEEQALTKYETTDQRGVYLRTRSEPTAKPYFARTPDHVFLGDFDTKEEAAEAIEAATIDVQLKAEIDAATWFMAYDDGGRVAILLFKNRDEATGFRHGVDWVNDSSLTLLGEHHRRDDIERICREQRPELRVEYECA